MSILNQKTIKQKISLSGVGIHTGQKVNLNILPANENTGIIFKRSDIEYNNIVVPNFKCKALYLLYGGARIEGAQK